MGRTLGMLASFLAAAALAAGCGDTLVDHGATDLVETLCGERTAACEVGGELQCLAETPTQCGPTCADCSANAGVPAGAVAACLPPAGGGQSACGFECTGGKLRCGDGCCDATAIAAGLWHTCAITSPAGSLVCWGDDEWGQITGVENRDIHFPSVAGPRSAPWSAGVTVVGAGQQHTCAVVAGAVRCVGWNDDKQAPELVEGLDGVVELAAGQRHTCALTSAGAVTCWGPAALRGGDDGSPRFTPIGSGARHLAAGRDHTCAVMTSGAVRCWGLNTTAQLGDGTTTDRPVPVEPLASGSSLVAGGHSGTCATAASPVRIHDNVEDAVRCWGAASEASWAMFGLAVPQPTPAIPLKDVNSSVIRRFTPRGIAMGKAHVCVLGDDAGVGIHCFGPENGFGELGTNAPPMTEEVLVPNSLGARSLAAGYYHTCAIWSDGGVRCWGMNNTGQLGTGDGQTRPAGEIVQVSGR